MLSLPKRQIGHRGPGIEKGLFHLHSHFLLALNHGQVLLMVLTAENVVKEPPKGERSTLPFSKMPKGACWRTIASCSISKKMTQIPLYLHPRLYMYRVGRARLGQLSRCVWTTSLFMIDAYIKTWWNERAPTRQKRLITQALRWQYW